MRVRRAVLITSIDIGMVPISLQTLSFLLFFAAVGLSYCLAVLHPVILLCCVSCLQYHLPCVSHLSCTQFLAIAYCYQLALQNTAICCTIQHRKQLQHVSMCEALMR